LSDVYKTVRPTLPDRCSVCNVGVLWPNSWTDHDQDETWHGGRPRPHSHSHIVLDGDPAPPTQKGGTTSILGPCLLWPNGWMDQDATWYGDRPRPRRYCVKFGPSSPPKRGHIVLDGTQFLPKGTQQHCSPPPVFGQTHTAERLYTMLGKVSYHSFVDGIQ